MDKKETSKNSAKTKKTAPKKDTLDAFKVDVKAKEPISRTRATKEEIEKAENLFPITSLHEAVSYGHHKLNEIKPEMSHSDYMDIYYNIAGTKY
jgi:hypothetical protein